MTMKKLTVLLMIGLAFILVAKVLSDFFSESVGFFW